MLYCVSEDRMKLIHQICGSLSLVEFWGTKCFPLHIYIYTYIYMWATLEHTYIYIYPKCWVFYAATNPLVVVSIQVAEGLHEIATFHILWHVPKSYLGHRRHGPRADWNRGLIRWFVSTWGSVFRQVFFWDSWTLDQTHSIYVWYIYLY